MKFKLHIKKVGKFFVDNIFLFVFVFFVLFGFYRYFHREDKITHFRDSVAISEDNTKNIVTQLMLIGQYKTKGAGFIAGELIDINILLYVNHKLYKDLKKWPAWPGAPLRVSGNVTLLKIKPQAVALSLRDLTSSLRKI